MQGIEIPIGAPLGKLNQDLDGAQQALKGFTVAANGDLLSIGKSLGTLERQLKVFKDGIKNSTDPGRILLLNNAIKATEAQLIGTRNAINGVGFNKFTTGSNQAAFALTNLGRVAQDAPFGFIGIQNNLNPLLESFQQLKAQSGSTSGALKALGQSLIGPAGLGIAFSVVSAAILFYQQYQQRANKSTKEAVDANKELADSIKSISGVQAEGRANASKDLSQLQSLYNATQNVNIPAKERLKIADDLIKRYPKYLSGLTAEQVLAGKAASAYISLTNAILAKGYAQAAEENRQKLINQQLNAKVEITKEQAALDKSAAELSKRTAQKQATLDIQGQAALEGGISKTSKAVENSKNKINELNQVYKNAASEIKILDDVTQGLIKTFGADVVIDTEKIDKSNKNLKTQSDILKALSVDFKQIASDVSITFGQGNEQRVVALKKAINDLISIGFTADSNIIKRLQTQLLAIDPDQIKAQGKEVGVNAAIGIGKGLALAGPVISKDFGNTLKLGLTDFQIYVNEQLLPKLQTNFETFFNNILMNGKLSFDSLGKALLNTLLSVIASDAARQVTSLLSISSGKDFTDSKKTGGGGLLGGIGTLLGIGAKAAPVAKAAPSIASIAATTGGFLGTGAALTGGTTATLATGTVATGGALLPILAGVAAIAGIASLFKKKQQAPIPQASSTISTSAAGSAQDFGGGRVVFEISGTNLVGVLNRAGAKLQRFGP
ncbi:hypothetical protein UFOVP950_25 [uncultured Caudovirales phage]|uniref:Uncharacterized protein n=1 Tax=uncultured Caudovirales phage TaxID=2100421 RepID=A0A6J5PMF9_9CAUD|nr:hypothetical protein UFOVP950_25 [uncultured Caudovirales phage]